MGLFNFFKPKWKSKNTEVRLAAVRRMDEQAIETLRHIIQEDEQPVVRRAALERIQDRAVLEELVRGDLEPDLVEAAQRKINAILSDTVLHAADVAVQEAALDRIHDLESLAAIAVEAPAPSIRLHAVKKIDDQEVLSQILEKKCGKGPARLAVDKIDDEALLGRVARSGASKFTRRLAEEKLAQIAAARMQPAEDELNELVRTAESLSASEDWESVQHRFDGLERAWRELDSEGVHPRRAAFDTACQRFDDRWRSFLQREEERREADARAQCYARYEAICVAAEGLVGCLEADAEERFRCVEEEWLAVASNLDDAFPKEFAERFERARRAYGEAREQLLRERSCLAELEADFWRAEERVEADDLDEAAETLGRISIHLDESGFEFVGFAGLSARVKAVQSVLEQKREAAAEAAAQAQQERLRKAEGFCAELEALIEAEDRFAAGKRAKQLRREWKELGGLPHEHRQTLGDRFSSALESFSQRQQVFHEEQEWARWANKQRKEELCAAVDALDGEEDLALVAEKVKENQRRWKAIGSVPISDREPLWQRFRVACDRNFERCKPYFEELERQRAERLERKEDLCRQAEELAEATEWKEGSEELKRLQTEWKEIGSIPRRQEEQLYARFRQSCDRFFERRKSHFEELADQRQSNHEQKEKLCGEAESLAGDPHWRQGKRFRELQAEWKQVGPAPRESEQELWERFRTACDRFFTWRDEQREENLRQKEALCEELEALLGETGEGVNMREIAAKIGDLQKRWKEIGPVSQERNDDIWRRFREPCDEFFRARREHFETLEREHQENETKKLDLLERAEILLRSDDQKEIAEGLRVLQGEWNDVGPATQEREGELRRRFRALCDDFFDGRRQHFEELTLTRHENLKKKEALCVRLERVIGDDALTGGAGGENTALNVAEQLKVAIESNFALAGTEDNPDRKLEEVRRIQQEWKAIGPVPREHNQPVWERYRRLLDVFYEGRRGDAGS